jgi:hypothetical protein
MRIDSSASVANKSVRSASIRRANSFFCISGEIAGGVRPVDGIAGNTIIGNIERYKNGMYRNHSPVPDGCQAKLCTVRW